MGSGSSQEVDSSPGQTPLADQTAHTEILAARLRERHGRQCLGAEENSQLDAQCVPFREMAPPQSPAEVLVTAIVPSSQQEACSLCKDKGQGFPLIDPTLGVRSDECTSAVESNADEPSCFHASSRPSATSASSAPPPGPGAKASTVDEMLALPQGEFLEVIALLFKRFDKDEDGRLDRKDFETLVHAFVLAFGSQAPEDSRLHEWLAGQREVCRETALVTDPLRGPLDQAEGLCMTPTAFSAFAWRFLGELQAHGHGTLTVPSAGLTAAMNCGHTLHSVKLDGSQFLRLPEGVPLRVLVGAAVITDRGLETNEELACEVRLYPARSSLTAYLFSEGSLAGVRSTEATSGEAQGEAGRASWLFGEELLFEGEQVGLERRAEGFLQAQVWLCRQSGEKVASTTLFTVPTDRERHEPLWTRAIFSKRIGHVSVAAGWVGPDLVDWLAGEVLRRANSGKWKWVVDTLRAMGPAEVHDMSAESLDEGGRGVLSYAAMCSAAEPSAALAVEILLKARVDPRMADSEGLTAVHYAAFAGADRALAALLAAGADPDVAADGGVTPLMLAALAGSLSTAETLLSAGAAAGCLDASGLTSACWACLGCGRPQGLSGKLEEARALAQVARGLHEAIDHRRSRAQDTWGGPDRRELLGLLTERLHRAAPPSDSSPGRIRRLWLPLVREAARPGPVRCGCFAELYLRLQRLQGLRAPVLGSVLYAAIADGDQAEEQMCRVLLRECAELPVSGFLTDGRTLTEAALDRGWDEVAILLCDRGAVLDADFAGQARALRAAVEGGHKELAKRLVGQWAEARDAWARPALPAVEGVAECPVCFSMLCENAGALFTEQGSRACQHLLCLACAAELAKQAQGPKCPICRHQFKPPARQLPDPREDPCGWFTFFDEANTGYLDRQLLEKVLPSVVPVDAGRLESALRGELWKDWDPAGEGRISRAAFCAERGLLRWLAEHLAELQEDKARGAPPSIETDREGWFRHWARPGASAMGKGEVLRAVLKSAGTSSLESVAVAASREWIERCWLMWDRAGSGEITLSDFCNEGGFADMLLRQSCLAAAKRVVRRLELEVHDPATLVCLFQQLLELATGLRPEDPPTSWPRRVISKLTERAAQPVRDEYEATLRDGGLQVVLAMKRNPNSAKLFAWGCRTLVALGFAPVESCEVADTQQQILDVLFGLPGTEGGALRSGTAPLDGMLAPALWRQVLQGFVHLLPEQAEPGTKTSVPSNHKSKAGRPPALAPGALREAGLCALALLRVLAERHGHTAGDSICVSLTALLAGRGYDTSDAGQDRMGSPWASFTGWIQSVLGLDSGTLPSAALVAWCSATVVTIALDMRLIVDTVLSTAPALEFVPCLAGFLRAVAAGLETRPPTSSEAASRFLQAMLTSIQRLPTLALGAAPEQEELSDGTARPRIRDGRIAVGDAVRMNPDLAKAKREQDPAEHFGGWCDRMAFCLDFPGRVVEIPRRAPHMPEVLRISHGAMGCWCWNVKVVTEVIPDVGLLPFEEIESGPGFALTIGDEVRVGVSIDEAKRLQVNHGGWNDRMSHCCGKAGRLEAIDKAGDMKVLVPGVGAFVWNPAALRAPHAQRWEAALSERVAGPLEGALPLSLLSALITLGGRLDEPGIRRVAHDLVTALPSAAAGEDNALPPHWNALALGALLVHPQRAAEAVFEKEPLSFRAVARPAAWAACLRDHPGLTDIINPDVGLLKLLEAWWNTLPVSERRSRSV